MYNKVVTPDKVIWAGYSASNGLYCYDGEFVYNYSSSYDFTTYLVKDRLIPLDVVNLSNIIKNKTKIKSQIERKDEIMENNLNVGTGSEALQKQLEILKNSKKGDVPKTATFNANDKVDPLKAVKDKVTEVTSKVKVADNTKLADINRMTGTLLGWITQDSSKLNVSAVGDLAKGPNGKPIALNNDANVQSLIDAGQTVSRKLLKKDYRLDFKMKKPSNVKYGIIKTLADTFVDIDRFEVKADGSDAIDINVDQINTSDFVIKALDKNELHQFLVFYYDGSIKESPVTHANPSEVFAKTISKESKIDDEIVTVTIPTISVPKRSLVTATNYIPRTVYKTTRLVDAKTDEEIAEINKNLFTALLKRTKRTPQGAYNNLIDEDKSKIQVVKDEVVGSKFTDKEAPLPITVSDPFTGEPVSTIEVVDMNIERKDGKLKVSPIKYDVAGKEEDVYGISPFKNPAYKKLIDATEGYLTEEVMKSLFRKSTNKNKSKSTASGVQLSNDQAMAYYLAASKEGGVKGFNTTKGINADTVKNLKSSITQTKLQMKLNR